MNNDAANGSEIDPAMPPEAARYVAETVRHAATLDWSRLRVWRDLPYGEAAHQRLDVFAPKRRGNELLPLFMYIHGGGWTHGEKGWMSFMAPAIAALPAVFASPNYGLAPDHTHPTPIKDCLTALAFIRKHAADYGANPDLIYIGGHSVGGHIASMIALRPDLRAAQGIPSGTIKACIPVSGLFRVLEEDPTAADDPQEASPMHWAAQADMPFYVSYGEKDYPRIVEENRDFIAALGGTGISLRTDELAGLDHYTANLCHGDQTSRWHSIVHDIVRQTR